MPTLSEEIVAEVRNRFASLNGLPNIRMVAISLGYTFVELEGDTMGVCFTPRSEAASCSHYPKAGTLAKKHILELTELMLSPHPLEKSVGIAAVNAVSQIIMDCEPEKYRFAKTDFLDLLPFGGERLKVGMVGNIGPFVPFLLGHASSLVIVDDNPALQPGIQPAIQNKGYTISRNIEDLADADVLIITGSAAAVGDFDQVIACATSARFIGVVGPSAGWLPDPAFRRGVHAVAATKIIDVPGARRAILEGGGTPHFIGCGRKYTLTCPGDS
ncbi:MAG: DUF364 domain-containing protein [Desulfosalsimonadaceae bacterium]